jgi:pimeloyl-ACP methyl ester carboxylesterase
MNDVPHYDRTRIVTTPDGRDLALCLWGDPQGAPIFWLHGTPGSRMFRYPSDCYQRYRLAVCSYDRPGYGLSTRRRGHTQAQNVDDVVAIADALGWERFAVAGASGGTAPALAVARFQPEAVTRCAVIVGAAPPTAEEIQAAIARRTKISGVMLKITGSLRFLDRRRAPAGGRQRLRQRVCGSCDGPDFWQPV